MAHIFMPDGRRLRLRLFPRPKQSAPRKAAAPGTLSLFDPPPEEELDTPGERLAAKISELCLFNRNNAEILARMPGLGLRDWWLASDCLFQTVWNLRSGRPADAGIGVYDVCYFSEDISWEAEDDVIRAAALLFQDLDVTVRLRNQARVHLWYPEKFAVAYPPLTSASEGILRFTSSVQAVGMKLTGAEFFDVYAPFGLSDVWNLVARPNRAMALAHIYAGTVERWQREWINITVYQWVNEDERRRPKS